MVGLYFSLGSPTGDQCFFLIPSVGGLFEGYSRNVYYLPSRGTDLWEIPDSLSRRDMLVTTTILESAAVKKRKKTDVMGIPGISLGR